MTVTVRERQEVRVPGLLTPTTSDLQRKREQLLAGIKMPEEELRRRAETYQLTADEIDVLREIDEIDFLLGK